MTELRAALDVVEHFIRKYGLANTSGEKHIVRRDLRNLALTVINEARAAISSSSATEAAIVAGGATPEVAARAAEILDSATETQDGERPNTYAAYLVEDAATSTPDDRDRDCPMDCTKQHQHASHATGNWPDDRDREVERIVASLLIRDPANATEHGYNRGVLAAYDAGLRASGGTE